MDNILIHNIILQANHKVGQAKINVGLTATYVDKALSDIAEIIKELEDLPELGQCVLVIICKYFLMM